jgi:hypothetical protein
MRIQGFFPMLGRRMKNVLCVFMLLGAVLTLSACGKLEEAVDMGDPNLTAVKAEVTKCWSCPMFTLAFDAIEAMYNKAQAATAGPAQKLMGVLFGLWLVIRVMKFVASLKDPDVGAFWSDLGIRVFWLTMGVALLKYISQVTNDLIFPTFSGFVDFGLMVVGRVPTDGGGIACPTGTPREGMLCLVTAIHERLSIGQELGFAVLIEAPALQKLFGAIIYIVSVFMSAVFPLFLLDAVLRFGIVMALLPLWIVAFCFPVGRGLAKKGWDLLLSVAFQTTLMSVFIALCVLVLRTFVINKFGDMLNPEKLMRDKETIEKVANGSPGIIGFLFICFFLVLFGQVILELVQNFLAVPSKGNVFQSAGMAMYSAAKIPASFAKKRYGKFKDKQAARTLETARRKEAAGEKMSFRDKLAKEKAQSRLQNRGYLDEKGKDTDSYGKLLNNSVMRDAMGKKDWSQGYVRHE